MFDFVKIEIKPIDQKYTKFEVYPEFVVRKSKDLMTRGKSFYAVWDEVDNIWVSDENYISEMIDRELRAALEQAKIDHPDALSIKCKYLSNFSSKKWQEWQQYVKSIPDNYHELDTKITFANSEIKKTDYISKRLPYDLVDGECPAYDELMNVLYSPDERRKLEWAIGAIISGDSKRIQKFLVLYGPPKSGKSTFLKIIRKLFPGYYTTFEAKALGNVNSPFALEAFKDNPLIAIQDDGDLSKIEDNTKLNQIISHESLIVNEKFKNTYTASFNTFLFMGTNKPVKITDAKSGMIRRLIDVVPTGDNVPYSKYLSLTKQIDFELGSIANRCLNVYKEMGENYYDSYVSINMMGSTNDIFAFMEEYSYFYTKDGRDKDGITLKELYGDYVKFAEDSNFTYKVKKTIFKEELKNYFEEYSERTNKERHVYYILRMEKFVKNDNEEVDLMPYKIQFNKRVSLLDSLAIAEGWKAQYAKDDGTPRIKWDDVNTTLADIDSHEVHYLKIPENYIVIDFDLKDEDGNKSYEKNLEAASRWPATYAELSKSGGGIHLHYIYDGDVKMLEKDFAEHIEIKVFTGGQALRRKLTKCNDVPIATINSGLPLKGAKKMVDDKVIKDERHLRNTIIKCLRKDVHPGTKPSVDFIYKLLEDAYKSGMYYDVSNMEGDIMAFANNSTNHAEYCVKLVGKMHFMSEDCSKPVNDEDKPIIFFDVEVFPNLFVLCWKYEGEEKQVTKLINPDASLISDLVRTYRLIGFNNRKYDNHILYAKMMGYTNYGLYELSQSIISEKKGFFGEAYNLSYTDIYDYASNANKMSLKKWEIKLGIHHQENAYPWDKDVDKSHWDEIADYCANDVIATEAVFNATKGDYIARQILSELSGLTMNDTTNSHSKRIVFGKDKRPQSEFNYIHLDEMFPGYVFKDGVSTYRGEVTGEGGYVYAEPGIYRNVALLDIASMHPSSIIAMNMFGDRYTKNYKDIKDARVCIKHGDKDGLSQMFDGKLMPFYEKVESGEIKAKDLSNALKTVINSAYGLTAASFDNEFRDPRNVDNIVAKRGALFMINLKHELQDRGYHVVHVKTDSIKVPNATKEIIDFVMEYGKKFGYEFEHEATYDRMCLVNDAVYVAQYDNGEWVATGKEFQRPYIFKTLFSGEKTTIDDMAETINVSKGALYLDLNERLNEDEHNMVFVGRVSSFVPIMDGHGGGILYRVNEGKNYAAAGTKGYRWLETEYVKNNNKEKDIDMSYYEKICEDAKAHVNEFGDFDKFVNDKDYNPEFGKIVNVPEGVDEEIPFEEDFINKPKIA